MTDETVYVQRKGRRTTPVADQTILVNTAATITVTLRDQNGEPATPTDPVTVRVVDSNGDDVVTSGTATTATGDGFAVNLPVQGVDMLTALWSCDGITTTTNVEVVGGYYFGISDLQKLQSITSGKYDAGQMLAARRWAERLIDRVCGTSFVERYQSDVLVREDFLYSSTALGTRVRFPDPFLRQVYGLTLDDAEFTQLSDLTILDRGRAQAGTVATPILEGSWTKAQPRYTSAYTDRADADVRTAALRAARYRLISTDGSSGIPSRASAVNGAPSIDSGRIDADHPTGIEEVDVILCVIRDQVRRELGT